MRVIRKENGKQAEIFTLVLNNTVEMKWFDKSHEKDDNYISIDEEGLNHVLRGEPYKPYSGYIPKFYYRF